MATYTLHLNFAHSMFDGLTDMQKKFASIVVPGDGIEQVFFVPLSPEIGEIPVGPTVAPPGSRQNMYRGTKQLKIDVNGFVVEDYIFNNWNLPVRSRIASHVTKGQLVVRLGSVTEESPNRIINFPVPGTGYIVGEILTLVGGTSSIVSTLRVTSVDGVGGITGAVIETFGSYTVTPANAVVTTSSDSGINATVNLTWDSTPLLDTDIIAP